MSRVGVVAVGLITGALISGCSGGSSSGGTPPPAAASLRGTELPAFSCAARSTGAATVVLVPDRVIDVRICPIPGPLGKTKRVTLDPSDARFAPLVNALSLPNATPTPMQACPEYAELRGPIIATDGSRVILVHVPVDGCDHSLPAVRAALSAVEPQ